MRAPGFNADDEPWDAFGDEPSDEAHPEGTAVELRDCPFCESGDIEASDGYCEDGRWVVVCNSCRSSSGYYRERAEAIARWNDRIPEDALRAQIATLETQPAPQPQALISDERISRDMHNCHTPRGYYKEDERYIEVLQATGLAEMYCDIYEQHIATLEQQLEQANRRIGQLEADLDLNRMYEPVALGKHEITLYGIRGDVEYSRESDGVCTLTQGDQCVPLHPEWILVRRIEADTDEGGADANI